MANPRADLEKLERAYTADPEPKCGCGAPMKLVDQYQYEEDWECLEVPDMHHRFNVSRSPGDPAVLEAVEEIRYLRQLVGRVPEYIRNTMACIEGDAPGFAYQNLQELLEKFTDE